MELTKQISLYARLSGILSITFYRGFFHDLPERCHGNDGVPECLRNAGKSCFRFVLFRVKHDRCEHDDRHCQQLGLRLQQLLEHY